MMHFSANLHALLTALALSVTAAGCATATGEGDPEEEVLDPPKCSGYRVSDEGECSIPTLGQGDIEAPPGDEPLQGVEIDRSDIDQPNFLNQEGVGKLVVITGETVDVRIRAITYVGQPLEGLTIVFELEGDTGGAVLSAQRAVTNEFGVAGVTVTGGEPFKHFDIQMSAENTNGLRYQVDVVQAPEGRPVDPADPGDPGQPPPPGNPNCMQMQGVYDVQNLYEPGRFLGDGVFNALEQIHQAVSNPGAFVADRIAGRIGGVAGSLIRGVIQPVVNYVVDYVFSNYLPDWAQRIRQVVDDVTAVLVELEIESTFELGAVDMSDCSFTGKHRWERLVFKWSGQAFPIELAAMGVALSESNFEGQVTRTLGPTAEVAIGEHDLQMNIGVAVFWFLENVVLPNRLGVQSFAELIQRVIPCDVVGDLAADFVGSIPFLGFVVSEVVEEACQAGVRSASDWLVEQLISQLNVDTFQMTGSCKMRDETGNQAADKIREGRWENGLTGDFTGQRR